jgi:DGQHR domain-containing protein
MSLSFPAIPFKQRNVTMYVAAVTIEALQKFTIDIWNPKNVVGRRGYQRKPQENRIKKIAKYLERKDGIMPAAGFLNVREKGRLKYKNGMLVIPEEVDIWVVDMQHRLRGIERAHDEGALKSTSFRIPVVITEGLGQLDEAAQFYIINTKAKKMDVALTRRLLIENDKVRDVADVKPWEITAVQLTIDLNSRFRGNPWFGRIRQPNEERLEGHVATERSFVSSLRHLLVTGKFKQHKKVAKKLAAYWSAIRENIPEAFGEPRKYLIQKTHGIFVFNFFIAPMFFHKYPEAKFVKQLSGLKRLGPGFWKRSNKRGARRFGTGMGGYSNLAAYLKDELF